MNVSIIDTSDCIGDIHKLVEEQRLSLLLSMGRWVVFITLVFGALCAILANPGLDNWLLLAWYGALFVLSSLLWLLTYRPITTIVNLPLDRLQNRFLIYITLLGLLWVAFDWYVGFRNPDPEHLFVVIQVQVFYIINCTYFLLNSRLVSYGFYLLSMLSPIALFLSLFLLTEPTSERHAGDYLRSSDYFWLMALLQVLYTFIFYLCIKRMVHEQASTVRLRTLHEISNSRLMRINKELESESNTDFLTGIANRRAYETGLLREWKRCQRSASSFALFVFDIDYFKKYNDRYGHLAGDTALKAVAEVVAERLRRPGDLVARYGGEEFVAIVTSTPMKDCRNLAESIRIAVQDLGLEHEDSSVSKVLTVSVGVAQITPDNDNAHEDLFNRADAALYSAKKDGRDCVVVYDESHEALLEQAGKERKLKADLSGESEVADAAGQTLPNRRRRSKRKSAAPGKPGKDGSQASEEDQETTQPRDGK